MNFWEGHQGFFHRKFTSEKAQDKIYEMVHPSRNI